NPNPATEPQQKTVHTLAWGLLTRPQTVSAVTCAPSNALDQVHVSSNLGYSLLTVLTLGFWAPLRVEWQCARRHEEEGFIGLQAPPPEEPPHAP
ncbi:MAG TPA: hypothetical protein VLQ93_09360, partial [Myxococcaceae bacterium]|nr:hypothetical protein [Myxococcaceae bacterium]